MCNGTTGHAIELYLSNINQGTHVYSNNESNYYPENWFLNRSSLLTFKELRILGLSHNGIGGWLGNEQLKNYYR